MHCNSTHLTITLKCCGNLFMRGSSLEPVDEREPTLSATLNHQDGGGAIGEFSELHYIEFEPTTRLVVVGCCSN